jgi:cytoskeletal protein CcmA (bactofilin family)
MKSVMAWVRGLCAVMPVSGGREGGGGPITDALEVSLARTGGKPLSGGAGCGESVKPEHAPWGLPRSVTVIASDACLSGDIRADGDLQVYGVLTGSVHLAHGTLRVMQGGRVEGECHAPAISINGLVSGGLVTATLDILAHGVYQGALQAASLSIAPGGRFLGQSLPPVMADDTAPESDLDGG